MKTKICTKCKTIKKYSEFNNNNFTKTKKSNWCKDCHKKNYEDNREERKAYSRNRYRNNPKEKSLKTKARRERIRKDALSKYGNRCICCGEDTYEFLSFDHVFNDGALERKGPEKMRGNKFYLFLLNSPISERYQILCHNCNMAKQFYGKCPHNSFH